MRQMGETPAEPAPRNPAFSVLMFGSSISMFGSRISTIAFPMLVLHLSGSPLLAGLVAFATIAPSMLVYIPAGALVDRLNPRAVMLWSEFGRGVAVAIVVVALALHHSPVALLIVVMIVEEILEIFSALADRRYVNSLIDRGKSSYAQACIEVRAHAVVLAGRPIGPFLYTLKPILPFLADAASFAFSVGSLIWIKGKKVVAATSPKIPDMPGKPDMPKRCLRNDIGEGFQWLFGDKYALVTAVLMSSTTLIAQALVMVFLAEAHVQQLSPFAVGFVLAASGVGGALGSLCVRWLPWWAESIWLQIQMCAWCAALTILAAFGEHSFLWVSVAMAILGFTGAIGNIEFGTYLVQRVDDHMLARVTSIGQVLAIGGAALGPVLGGWAIQRYGGHGAVMALLALVVLLTVFSMARPGTWAKMAGAWAKLAKKVAVGISRPRKWLVLPDTAEYFRMLRKCCRRMVPDSVNMTQGSEPSPDGSGPLPQKCEPVTYDSEPLELASELFELAGADSLSGPNGRP